MIQKTIATLIITTFAAFASSKTVGDLEVKDFWIRSVKGSPNTAAYMTISNKSLSEDKLIKVDCPEAATVEIHDHIHENGIAKMRPVESIQITSHSEVSLQKGGKHIMLMGVKKAAFEDKKEIPLTLHFEKAGTLEIMASVKD